MGYSAVWGKKKKKEGLLMTWYGKISKDQLLREGNQSAEQYIKNTSTRIEGERSLEQGIPERIKETNANTGHFWRGEQKWTSGSQCWKVDFLLYILNFEPYGC